MVGHGRLRKWCAVTRRAGWLGIMLGLAVLLGGRAEASVNLPTHHWAYEAIERLTAMGVIDRAMVVAKPYTRQQAARYVAKALKHATDEPAALEGQEAVAGPLLERLVREFRPELARQGVVAGNGETKRDWLRYGGRLQTEVDGFFVGHQTVRFRENRGGEYYANGPQLQTDVRGWLELTDAVAIVAQPKFISNVHVLGIGATNNDKNIYMRELNVKVTLANIALEVGRGTQWWGPGYHGTLLLSDHAFPMDMIKLGSEDPFRLPWVLQHLGEWKVNTFLTQLERDRDFPRAKVFGLRLSYQPAGWLELGFTRLTQFDGRGQGQSFPTTVINAYIRSPSKTENLTNEQAMLDVRLRIPHVPYLVPFAGGMQLYGELGAEDRWNWFGSHIRALPKAPAYLTGLYIPQLFRDDSMDLRVEWADTVIGSQADFKNSGPNVWYSNSVYRSGMRYKGFPIGHHMGPDATDFFVRTTRQMSDNLQVGVNLDFQRRGLLLPVHESKIETTGDVTWWLTRQTSLTVAYTFQQIKNPGQITAINPFQETFAAGLMSNNHLLWTNLTMEF
jgi:hypothetical protein